MQSVEFVEKWRGSRLGERQASQEHFIDLCRLLGQPTPAQDDTTGERYCFERGAEKVGGGKGWADVWRRGCFGWEYKGHHADLGSALRQLQAYALNLENPPFLVVSDMERIEVHTNWTNTVSRRLDFELEDLLDPAKLDLLRQVFEGSERLKPGVSTHELTAKAAERFGDIGRRLQERGEDPRVVAHFLNRLVFCMFAERVGLLPDRLLMRMLRATETRPDAARAQLCDLFGKMARQGDTYFGVDPIRWFNGGLFDDDTALALPANDLRLIADTAEEYDWSQLDPSIFGTLFEQALKATRERPALGAHYTDRAKILKIVEPVIIEPLVAEWTQALAQAQSLMSLVAKADGDRRAVFEGAAEAMRLDPLNARAGEGKRQADLRRIARERDTALRDAKESVQRWLDRLAAFQVLDPACGSGNFLYVALHALLDLEQRAILDASRIGLTGFVPRVTLANVRGIEIDRYAAELARLTLWIGYLQWARERGGRPVTEPVLSTLDQIENRDALLTPGGEVACWPAATVIIGNPPFVGGKLMRTNLGDEAVDRLFLAFRGRVPAEADLVCYWVQRAWEEVEAGRVERVGLVTTNSIRGGANRRVLAPIADANAIFEAWADEPWTLQGAAVRVSMIGFGQGFVERRLGGRLSTRVNADLSGGAVDLTKAVRLRENAGVAFMGDTKGGAFDVPGELARQWLRLPLNPNGRPNRDVLRPWRNSMDVTRRSADKWIIDFGWTMSEAQAALYEAPFAHVADHVRPERSKNAREAYRTRWWQHVEPRPGMWAAACSRNIVTPTVAKHRLFGWLDRAVCPDHQLICITRDDDTTFGVLHSKFHEVWSLRLGTSLEDRPRYTPSTTFETFPFPEMLTPATPSSAYAGDPLAKSIAAAAVRLVELRDAWLNPADLVQRVPEVAPGYPDRLLPVSDAAARDLAKRTLTNLYNTRPSWLDAAHRDLDAAVAAAYGWPADLTDDEIVERLLALNLERAAR